MAERRILTSFTRVLPLGEEGGDYPFEEEHGWIDEEGVVIEPDDYDLEDGMTPEESIVEQAVKFLRGEYVTQASSTHFHPGVWYSTEFEVIDYRTGEEEERSFHLKGFTPEEQRAIFDEVVRRRR